MTTNAPASGHRRGPIPTPWHGITKATGGGIRPGDLWVLAGGMCVGKTWISLMWAALAERVSGCPVNMHSDTPVDVLARRLELTGQIRPNLLFAGQARSWGIVEHHAIDGPASMIVVDGLHMTRPRSGRRQFRLALDDVLREAKESALEMRIPVLVTVQLSRAARQRTSACAKEVGRLGRHANRVLVLDRDGDLHTVSTDDATVRFRLRTGPGEGPLIEVRE